MHLGQLASVVVAQEQAGAVGGQVLEVHRREGGGAFKQSEQCRASDVEGGEHRYDGLVFRDELGVGPGGTVHCPGGRPAWQPWKNCQSAQVGPVSTPHCYYRFQLRLGSCVAPPFGISNHQVDERSCLTEKLSVGLRKLMLFTNPFWPLLTFSWQSSCICTSTPPSCALNVCQGGKDHLLDAFSHCKSELLSTPTPIKPLILGFILGC